MQIHGNHSDYIQDKAERLLENEQVTRKDDECGPFTDIYHVTGDTDDYTVLHHKEADTFDCPCQHSANNESPCSHIVAVQTRVNQ